MCPSCSWTSYTKGLGVVPREMSLFSCWLCFVARIGVKDLPPPPRKWWGQKLNNRAGEASRTGRLATPQGEREGVKQPAERGAEGPRVSGQRGQRDGVSEGGRMSPTCSGRLPWTPVRRPSTVLVYSELAQSQGTKRLRRWELVLQGWSFPGSHLQTQEHLPGSHNPEAAICGICK